MTREEAARLLHEAAAPDSLEVDQGSILTSPSLARAAYRLAARRHRSDALLSRQLTEARALLRAGR